MSTGRNTISLAIVACLLWSTAYAGIELGLQYDTPSRENISRQKSVETL